MIYVLNIGYESYMFASSRGLQTVMDALAKARKLKHHYYQGCEKDHPERLDLDDGAIEVSMHVVSGVSFVSGKSRREVIEPEVLPRTPHIPSTPRKRPNPFSVIALHAGSRREVSTETRLMLGEGT